MVQKIKKRFCPMYGTKALKHFCDTTQIDVIRRPLASRTIMRARWITGGIPSASTWLPVQAALGSPFRPDPTTQDSLCIGDSRLLLFLTGLLYGTVVMHYNHVGRLCQPFFRRKENLVSEHTTARKMRAKPRNMRAVGRSSVSRMEKSTPKGASRDSSTAAVAGAVYF